MPTLSIFPALVQNAALLLAMAFVYDVLTSRRRLGAWPLPAQMAVGAVLGLLGCIIMLSSWIYVPGIIFDTRSVLLGIAGLFFGVVPTAAAMTITALFRLFQGGAAALTGVAVICTTGAIGLLWRHFLRRPLEELSWRELYCFGLVVHLDMLAMMLLLPWPVARNVLAHITLPVLAIYPLATALLGMLMVNRLRREGLASELAAGEERLRLALAAANQGLYDLDVQTGEARVSPEYATMLGYDPAEFHETNASWIERLHPDDREPVAATYRDYIAGRISDYRVEFRQRTKGGEWKWILSLGKVVEHDDAGRPLRMLGTHTDITVRKQTEETLRLFKVLVENASDAIAMATPEGRHFYQNRAFTNLFGEVGENRPATLYLDQDVAREVFQTIMAGRRWSGEVRMYAKDRRVLNILLRAYANKDADGRIISLVGIHTDITDWKQAEEALRQSEQRFRSLVEEIPTIAVQGYDRERRIVFWNKASEQLYGFTKEEALGQRLEELVIPPAMRAEVVNAVSNWITRGITIPPGELLLQGKGGRPIHVFSSHAMQTNSLGEPVMYCIDIDLTDRKRAEEEKRHLQSQLLQAQKMESIGRLAGGVAHDFNNMLQTILGYCDLTLQQVDAGNPLHENLVEIGKAARRSADLTRQLLAFARKQTASPRVLDLNDTLAGMLKMLQRLIGENIDLVWVPGHDLWRVRIDPSQLDQILANLAVNARDAIADIGRITIATENAPLDAEFCATHPDCTPGDYVLLSVHDTGCGMDQTTLAQIFEPFFTTKEQGKGTGLGLATVYGIIRQNDGLLLVESTPRHGTAFNIYLPRVAEAPAESLPASVVTAPAGGTETVLLAEDEVAILNLAKAILELGGYTVLTARSAAAALERAQEHAGSIHLLITDVVMPEMNGHELARQLCARRPETRCLYMSGYTADIIARHGVLREGMHFIQKPFTVADFTGAVRRALDEQPKGG
ncbi:MAG: PAS domain S-box protein [Thermodesulfobacteriota bacterium]